MVAADTCKQRISESRHAFEQVWICRSPKVCLIKVQHLLGSDLQSVEKSLRCTAGANVVALHADGILYAVHGVVQDHARVAPRNYQKPSTSTIYIEHLDPLG